MSYEVPAKSLQDSTESKLLHPTPTCLRIDLDQILQTVLPVREWCHRPCRATLWHPVPLVISGSTNSHPTPTCHRENRGCIRRTGPLDCDLNRMPSYAQRVRPGRSRP